LTRLTGATVGVLFGGKITNEKKEKQSFFVKKNALVTNSSGLTNEGFVHDRNASGQRSAAICIRSKELKKQEGKRGNDRVGLELEGAERRQLHNMP
jgi:hypothetical protein